ncbi:DedA family protein [Pseudochrobactrum asaccharolyticum]|uniref:Membrane protein DedA with SNARE-associated domain n=1 Tax=Pseudochrobactrum asaccharolyticum TaxID=354351 RepID=A0A366E856_9HYPH|nr:DedA family protein [Pseudochrobactrum asaccharolyticum]RBO98610.1 membrane protein DedA with SNARE-associated domain [Pseudochrobactrum asaccharolyticum]
MHWIEPYIATYGSIALFITIYFESFGAPVPGESILIAASLLAQQGTLSLPVMLMAVFLAAILGDSTGYLIGHFGGRKVLLRFCPYVKLTPERLEKFEALFEKYGSGIVITARFFAILRQLNGIMAGALKMHWLKFVAANIIGAALWTLVWGAGPYYFSAFFRSLL